MELGVESDPHIRTFMWDNKPIEASINDQQGSRFDH